MITIRHTHEDGTLLLGSRKGDGVLEIARRHGWEWRPAPGIHIPHSRDKDAQTWKIDPFAEALRAAGHTVTVTVDNTWRPAAEREADRAARVDARVERLETRAERASAEAVARRDAARAITDGIPFGQPVQPPGHHSRNVHLRALDRADNHDRKRFEADDKARRLADRASGAAANEDHKQDPRAIMRKVDTLEAERRGITRSLKGYTRNFRNNQGEIYTTETHGPASGEWAEQLRSRAAMIDEEVAHLRGKLADMGKAGRFVAWGPEHFQSGDLAKCSGGWCEVARVNKKSVSVRGRWHWSTPGDKPVTVTWDEIHGRRRDGMQCDTPNGESWPVALAKRVERWGQVNWGRRAVDYPHGSPEQRAARHALDAVRIVHGLDLNASDAQVKAIRDSITGVDECRDLADRYLTAFDRLEGGEKPADIAASLQPITGDPAWRIPAGRKSEDRRAGPGWPHVDGQRFVEPGDLVAGVWDRPAFGGGRPSLLRHFAGPVAAVSEVLNRREVGEFITITLDDGTEREFNILTRLAVYPRGTWEDTPDTPAQPVQDTEPTSDTEVSATVWTGATLDDGTHRVLAGLATDLTRAGEDVHAGNVWRLARSVITGDAAAALDPGEVLHRLRDMRAPQHIRPRIERAIAGIADVLAPWPRERAAQLRPGATVRARMTVGDQVWVVNVAVNTVDTVGCGCRRLRATRPDGDTVELLTGCTAHPCEVENPIAVDTGAAPDTGLRRVSCSHMDSDE